MFEHPHAATVWNTIEVGPNRELIRVLVIETPLRLNALDPQYDEIFVNDLLGEAYVYFERHKNAIDRISIREIGRGRNA